MAHHWSITRCCFVGLIICLFQSNGAFTIQKETGLDDLKQFIDDLSSQVQALNNSIQKERKKNVMFYAVIRGKTYTYNVDANVVFETIIVNEGGHYDRFDGVFVAPVAGTYLFSWTVSGHAGSFIVTELMVENNLISSAGEQNGGGGSPSGSMTALCIMNAGDHAWIRTTGVSSSHVLYSKDNYPQSGFMGMLVQLE